MNRWSLFFIIILIVIPQIGIDLYLPSAPAMLIAFHTTMTMVQLTLATYTIGMGISQLVYGPVSDSIGRKPVILFGTLIFIIGSIVCSFTQSIDVLLLGRFIQGVGIGFGSALSRAILRDLCHDKKRLAKLVSIQAMSWSTVPLIAPVFGGYIQHYFYWRLNFYILLGIGVFLFLSVFFRFKESRLEHQRTKLHLGNTIRGYFAVIRRFSDFVYMLVIAFQYGTTLTIAQLSPFIFQNELGYSASIYGWFIFVIGFGSFIGAFVNRSLSQKFSLNDIILSALLFAFIIATAMNIFAIEWFNAWVIVIPILFIRFAGGLVYSNCVTQTIHNHPENVGAVSALFGTMAMTGGSVISAIVAHLPHYKQVGLSGSLGVQLFIMLVMFSSVFFFKRKHHQ